jgi:hypothetical protein
MMESFSMPLVNAHAMITAAGEDTGDTDLFLLV